MPPVAIALSQGIGGALLGVAAGAASAAAIAINTTIFIGGTLALGFISKALQPSRLPNFRESRELLLTRQGGLIAREIAYGQVRSAGFLSFHASRGGNTGSEFYYRVNVYACHEVSSFISVRMGQDGIDIPTNEFNSSGYCTNSRYINTVGSSLLVCKFYTGDQTSADPMLVFEIPEWSTNHIGYDQAYVAYRLQYDRSSEEFDPSSGQPGNVWRDGLPEDMIAEFLGKKVRNFANNNIEYSSNAANVVADYMVNSLGMSVAPSRINTDAMQTARSDCDDEISVPNTTGTENRWEINGVVSTGRARAEVLEGLLSCMAGRVTYVNGQYEVNAGVWKTPSFTITNKNIRTITEAHNPPRRQKVNVVRGTYNDRQRVGQNVNFQTLVNSSDVSNFGSRISATLNLPYVTGEYQAQRAGLIKLRSSQAGRNWKLTAEPIGRDILPNEVGYLNATSFGVSSGQTVRVIGTKMDPGGGVELLLNEDYSSTWVFTASNFIDPGCSYIDLTTSVGAPPASEGSDPASGPGGVGLSLPSSLHVVEFIESLIYYWVKAGGADTTQIFTSLTNTVVGATYRGDFTGNNATVAGLTPGTTYYAWARSQANGLVSSFHPIGGGVSGVPQSGFV